jgi:tetratricopeptide (TPR) repeat protein
VVFALLGAVSPAAADADAAGRCTAANEAWLSGKLAASEKAARECLAAQPDNMQAWYYLSRALGAQQKFAEAQSWIDKALKETPEDMDWKIWQIRLWVWSGKLEDAWTAAQALPAELAENDQDIAQLVANIAFFREDYQEAIRRYDSILAYWTTDRESMRRRGIAYKQLGLTPLALADFRKLCEMGDEKGCLFFDGTKEEAARFQALVQPAFYVVAGKANWWSVYARLQGRVSDKLSLAGFFDYRERDFGLGKQAQQLTGFWAGLKLPHRTSVTAQAAVSTGEGSAPRWTVNLEPGLAFRFGLETYLMYWLLQHPGTQTHILSPAVFFTWRDLELYARYYLSFQMRAAEDPAVTDDPRPASTTVLSSAFGRAAYRLKKPLRVRAGLAYGRGNDYADSFAFVGNELFIASVAGADWDFGWRTRLAVDYVFRLVGKGSLRQQEQTFLGAVSVRF